MLKSIRCIVALGALAVFGSVPPAIRAVEPGKPAVTALETTAYRAIGAKHPDPNIRNDDYLAERFLGTKERAILKAEGSETVLAALELDTVTAWKSLGPGIHLPRRFTRVRVTSTKCSKRAWRQAPRRSSSSEQASTVARIDSVKP